MLPRTASCLVLISGTTAALAADFTDTGFETPVLQPGGAVYNPNFNNPGQSPWTFTNNAGLSRPPSGFGAIPAPQGDQYAFLQVDLNPNTPTATICQTISGLVAGTEYFFSAQFATRVGCITCQGPADVEFRVDGNVVGTVPGEALATDGFDPFATVFTATATSSVLCLAEPVGQGFADATTFADDVHVGLSKIFADGFEGS